ncbi:low affinity immunoglobulin gamma Fc region receptor II-a-like [Larimichthys crocea]|uniref:low affinity immunoglobulin gamma Fc region receptor II-a-like n=1 Tax=Larimichthys crocea TaxID=215358 RepID=UPI000F601851|nr:low affinity immunoglobulin gamma Fc region receptor II-a-like [Larimichthys crocea]
MRTLREITPTNISNWETSAGSGTITPAFSSDSGEYWCEDGDGRRSNALNISVTAGSVILESPVHVTEGDHVTLKCQKKKDSGHLIAEYYKDGHRMKTIYEGDMTISNVSASDEGLYKCNISGAGESPESWLAVRDLSEPCKDSPSSGSSSLNFLAPLWIVVTFLLLSLLLSGVALYRKHKSSQGKTKQNTTTADQLGPQNATYAVVKKRRGEDGDNVVDPQDMTYATVRKSRDKKNTRDFVDQQDVTYSTLKMIEPRVSKASAKQCLPEGSAVYSTLTFAAGNVSTENRDT